MDLREVGPSSDAWIAVGLLVPSLAATALLVWYVLEYLAGLPDPIPL